MSRTSPNMMRFVNFISFVIWMNIFSPCLSVTYPPSFIEMPPKEKVFIPAEAILLPCVAKGAPTPKYVWYKNGKEFNWAANAGRYTKWPDVGTLVIARPGTDDDGMYQCVAVNQFGTAISVVINVKRAELGDFPPTPIVFKKVRYGSSIELPCNVPVGFPPPIVTWQTEKNSQIQYLKETNRRATDMNGYLWIATATEADHDTLYTCVAYNEVLRIQKSGPSYRLWVEGRPITVPLKILQRTPRRETVAVGDILRLRCLFGGYPEPQYTWFRNDKDPINLPNVQIKNLGTMLEFNPVTLESAGSYRCQGMSESTRITENVQYTVEVKVRPTLIEKPQDITVPLNGSVTFRCTATGDPKPQIRWTVNGQDPSTYLDGVRKLLEGDVMHLMNLTLKDTAVIQCNASNVFGYDFVNAYVNVMREPPYFMKPPQTELRAVDGYKVTIFCQTFSAPKAIISWTKDRRPINGGRYQSMPNGDLQIESVAVTDSGVYECTATNPFGSRKAAGRLLVRRRTKIVLAPISTRVYENDVVKFVCTAETDPDELQNLKITWYKDDFLIDPTVTPRIQRVWFDYSLVLSGAQPRDTGQYRCNASNGLDFATATASLLVQGKPEQAVNVQVNCADFINDELALVSWFPGADNYAPIMEYMVEYSTQFERDTWYPAEIFNLTGLVQSTSVKVILRPNIQYQFRVRTRNRVGVSLPSLPTVETCGIPGQVPVVNPTELYVFGSLRNNLIIRWTTIPYIEHYANNLGYLLNVQCLNCDFIPRSAINTTVIGDWRTDRITYTTFSVGTRVYEMETYKEFLVTIQSRNEKGVSKAPPTQARGFSGEAVPTTAPPVPTILNVTSSGAKLQWTAITQAESVNVNGFFRGYRLEWCDASLDAATCALKTRFQDVILQTPNTPVLYTNRRRRSVTYVDPYHESDHNSSKVNNHIHEYESPVEKYLPPSLRIYHEWLRNRQTNSTPSSICRSHRLHNVSCPGAGLFPRSAQSPSVLGEAYSIILPRVARQATQPGDPVLNNPTVPIFQWGQTVNFTLTNVPGALAINLWMRILNNRFAGPRSNIIQLTTLEGLPGPVDNLRADSISVNYVDISWTPPAEPNGNITGYEFEAMPMNQLDLGFGFRYPAVLNSTVTTYRMARLKPNTTYRITVWALTSAGIGVDNFIDIRTLPSDQAPNPPTFVVTRVTETGFTILYEPSHTGPPGTVFFVQYRQPGIVHWLESEPTFMNRTIAVDSLMIDTAYMIRMVATNGDVMSAASDIRLIQTLGGPRPGGLSGESGIWFIIVCSLLIFFAALLVLLILVRIKRLESVQKKATAPEYQHSLMSPEYARPTGPDGYPMSNDGYTASASNFDVPPHPPAHRLSPQQEMDEEQWSPSNEEGDFSGSEGQPRSGPSRSNEPRYTNVPDDRWQDDRGMVSPDILSEEEPEHELDRSPGPSDWDEMSYDARSISPQPTGSRTAGQSRSSYIPPSRNPRLPTSSRRQNNSDFSHLSGDPTVI